MFRATTCMNMHHHFEVVHVGKGACFRPHLKHVRQKKKKCGDKERTVMQSTPSEYTSVGGASRSEVLSRSGDIHAIVPFGPLAVTLAPPIVASVTMARPKSAILADAEPSTNTLT
jgi:hypothetical protein